MVKLSINFAKSYQKIEKNESTLYLNDKKEPVRIMITSKSLLSFLKEKRGVAHIDTTYKITIKYLTYKITIL